MTDAASEDEFQVAVDREGELAVVRPQGELDLATVGRLADALAPLREQGTAVLLDLDGLTFIDSSGLRLLLTATAAAQDAGQPLTLRGGQPNVARTLELCGVLDHLPFGDAPAAA
jgi:anti-sigma B factor antagonist